MRKDQFLVAAIASAFVLASASAQAATSFKETFTGTVSGIDPSYSGPFASALVGQSWTETFTFSLIPSETFISPTEVFVLGGSSASSPSPLISASVSVNGSAPVFEGSNNLGSVSLVDNATNTRFASLAFPNTSTDGLAAEFFVNAIVPAEFGNFTLSGSGEGALSVGGSNLNAQLTMLSVSAVPEPGSWALFILGFGGIGAMMRRQRSPHAALA